MALILALAIWAVALMTGYFLVNDSYWMPHAISDIADRIDGGIVLTLWVTGIAFFAAQGLLGWVIFRYRDRGGEGRASYLHGNNVIEFGGMALTFIVFVGLAVLAQSVWADVHLTESPPGALRVEVTGEQFLWNIRYPGPDGTFGRTAPRFYEKVGNTVGIDPDDPAGRDDIITINNIGVPVNRPVELVLRSKDVLHDLFLPYLRIKQDAVPGLEVPLRFTARETGVFEIACAELCGLGHYQMRAFLRVMEPAEYDAWLEEMAQQ